MSCYNSTRLVNKGYRPWEPSTSQYIDCSCGRCDGCRLLRQSSIAYRLQVEYLFNPGVVCFFITLSYSPKYLPLLSYLDKNGDVRTISVWNRQHVQRYNKRLRRKLQYYYGVDDNAFRYFVCCERGSDDLYFSDSGKVRRATLRPHYHGEYMVRNADSLQPIRSLPRLFYAWCASENKPVTFVSFMLWLFDKEWFYGNTKDLTVTRDISSCINYVSKYVTKDPREYLNYIQPEDIVDLYDYEYNERYNSAQSRFLDRINAGEYYLATQYPSPISFASLLPRYMSSINLGADLLRDLSPEDLENRILGKVPTLLTSAGKPQNVPFPQYYINKLCRESYQVPYDESFYSSDGIYYNASPFSKVRVAVPDVVISRTWNNVDGLTYNYAPKVYTRTRYSDFGLRIRDLRFDLKVQYFVDEIQKFFSIPDYFAKLKGIFKSGRFSVLDSLCQFDCPYLPSVDYLRSFSVDSISSAVRVYLHSDFRMQSHLTGVLYHVSNLLKTIRLCNTVMNFVTNAVVKLLYKKRLGAVALQDPELLLSHFISLNYGKNFKF